MSEPIEEGLGSPGHEQRMKKSRASRPKVKTGCQTCKIRRVKCDETKPHCIRCTKFGHRCDGYALTSSSKAFPNAPLSRAIIPRRTPPRQVSPESPALPVHLAPIRPLVYNPPTQSLFQDGEEYRCFQRFCFQTSRQLSSFFTKDLWTKIMLQACETSPSIRQAILSIGALNLSSSSVKSSEVGTLRHQFAYRQYSKSICLMRRDGAGGHQDLRTTLIGCLLFYCFESFQGYHELAISQVYSGLRMIREWATSLYKPDAEGKRPCIIGSENPYIIEDDILRAFGNLEIQVMSYADKQNAELHDHYRQCGQIAIDKMPSSFPDLKEARTMLELVIRRSMHWLRSTMHLQNFSGGERKEKAGLGFVDEGRESGGPASLFFDVDPTFEEQRATLSEYERWDKAFQPLLQSARAAGGGEKFLFANTLRLHWLAGCMSIASNSCRSALTNSNKFTSELDELVDIAKFLMGQPVKMQDAEEDGAGFVFDMQIIVPLMTVGWINRHRALRRQGIDLLLRSPRKKGMWDGIVVGNIMSWLSSVEEEGMLSGEENDDYIPERAAARCIEMSFDTEKREAHASCMQPVRGGLTGKEVKREIVIPW